MLEFYEYRLTAKFKKHLSKTLNYIKYEIKNVPAADALLNEIEKVVIERSKSPKIDKPFYEDKYSKKSVYKIKVRNFYVIYILDEDKKEMECIDFIYARRDFTKYKCR